MKVTYCHPALGGDGKRLSYANIIWSDPHYRVSRFTMKNGRFPSSHPCAPFDDDTPHNSSQMGGSKKLTAFRERGYWASCFPEGDGITLQWWDMPDPAEKTAEQVMKDIRDCFGWEVELRK